MHASQSLTWVNKEHGTSAKEVSMLDQVEEIEKKEDSAIDAMDRSAHVVNVDFEVEVTINNPIILNPETKMTTEPEPESKELAVEKEETLFVAAETESPQPQTQPQPQP